jgi:hypothetical protein
LATDGSWVQRFPATTTAATTTTADKTDGSDFGAVLANMLQCQTWASQKKQLTPVGFVRRYLGWKNLRHLERNFDYSQSQVHLVATVPGDQDCRQTSNQAPNTTGSPPPGTAPNAFLGPPRFQPRFRRWNQQHVGFRPMA